MESVRSAFRQLRITDYATKLEISSINWSADQLHPHAHAIVSTPSGGRAFVSPANFQDAWMAALPGYLHPAKGGTHLQTVRDLNWAASYWAKSAYVKCAIESDADVHRVVDSLMELKGIQKFNLRGAMAA